MEGEVIIASTCPVAKACGMSGASTCTGAAPASEANSSSWAL